MISTAPALLLALAISVGTTAQGIPQCQRTCQDAVASSTGCSGPSAPCGCDSPYQSAMLQCLAKPVASGGCSYDQIISWTNTIQTQCFTSPPILAPCFTICPLQAQLAANCSSDTDNACICGVTYTTSASACFRQACTDQFQSWNSGHLDLCNGATPSGPISDGGTASPSPTVGGGSTSGGTTITGASGTVSGVTTGTVTTSTSPPSQGSGDRVQLGSGLTAAAAIVFGVAYGLF